MEQDGLISVVYTSRATEPFDDGRLAELLTSSRESNGRADVSGFLLHREGRFIQFLEGPAGTVRSLVQKIAADPRHTRIRVLLEDPITARRFAEWTMGYEPAAQDGDSEPEGFRRSFDDLESGADDSLMAQAARDLTLWFRARSPAPAPSH